jgi:hypothetical protein
MAKTIYLLSQVHVEQTLGSDFLPHSSSSCMDHPESLMIT